MERLAYGRRRRRMRLAALVVSLMIGSAACDPGGSSSGAPVPSAAPASPGSEAAATAATGSAAAPAKPAHPHAGEWRGEYDAEKGSVTLPDGVRDPSWKGDDGSRYIGKGSVKVSVADDGSVSGSADGALGAQSLRGMLDDGMLRAALTSDEADGGMSGVLTGPLKGGRIEATLRVSDGGGNLVRQALVKLTRVAGD